MLTPIHCYHHTFSSCCSPALPTLTRDPQSLPLGFGFLAELVESSLINHMFPLGNSLWSNCTCVHFYSPPLLLRKWYFLESPPLFVYNTGRYMPKHTHQHRHPQLPLMQSPLHAHWALPTQELSFPRGRRTSSCSHPSFSFPQALSQGCSGQGHC